MDQDYEQVQNFDSEVDDQIDQKNAFNSNLANYLNYQRQELKFTKGQSLKLMNIDVSGTVQVIFRQQEIENQKGERQLRDFKLKKPLIQIYCTTFQGNSVCVNVRDFVPYFYVEMPQQLVDSVQNLDMLKCELNKRMKDYHNNPILRITSQKGKRSMMYYAPDEIALSKRYMKIQLISQVYVAELRKIFESGQKVGPFFLPRQTYESNIPYLLRFMIDKQIVGMGWFQVNKYKIINKQQKMTRCQLQIQASVQDITALPCQGQYAKIAPQRILSFDIECAAEHGFPSAQKDKVIQIACVCKRTDKQVQDYKVVFVLDGASPISGVHIKNMKGQREMLQDFQKLIITYDPDFIIGYNMINFDLKYLLERAKTLGMKNYGFFGRNLFKKSYIKQGKFQSKVMGMRQTYQIDTDGRIQLDLLIHMHKQHKLTSYRLNNVSFHFLGDQKQDVHHTQITKLYKQSMDGRKRLAIYCLKDADLPLRLMEKLCCLYNYSEMARVTGVPVNFLLSRGQQIKVVSQLLRKAKKRQFLMPTIRSKGNSSNTVSFEGAFVLDPKPGFYQMPIATLDFASLYPSIMMAHNLCYTTLVKKIDLDAYGLMGADASEKVGETPQNFYFVKPAVKKGLLPQILQQLIAARKAAKRQLANTTDPMLQKVLDGRQLALKISANSVYGFTGAVVGQLPCLQISSSVTSFGRQMIQRTRSTVQKWYDADVIYGDTDSVMVKFPLKQGTPLQMRIQAMQKGKEAASKISQLFGNKAIKLQFQKVYHPYLLIAKKRYAGVYYSKPENYDKIDKKGIEAVRRDNCLLIRQVLQNVLHTVLAEGDRQKAIKYIQETIRDLLQNKIDISKLVISKAISKQTQQAADNNKKKPGEADKDNKKTYKSKQAHTELAQKMKKRDENIEINIGDRIPYVMIHGAKWSKNYDNAEDPQKVLQQDLPIDYDYYINKQIRPPLQRLLKNTHIVDNFEMLFSGEHTKVRYAPKISEKSALGSFLMKSKAKTCIGCKRNSQNQFCQNCQNRIPEIYLKVQQQHNNIYKQKCKLMAQCGNCQRFITNNVICQNFDCPIFYRRIKVNKQLDEKQKQIERFSNVLAW